MSSAGAIADLRRACGDRVEDAREADVVGGAQPLWVVRPGSTAEVSEVLRAAAAHDLATVVRGTGTKLGWGAPPERCDVVLDVGLLDHVVEHTAGDLVAVTGAGVRVSDLQQRLAGSGQCLGVDPPRSGTVGGVVATGSTGPLRLRHGAVRDLVIGMTLVRADGVVAHSGGKVVKNVAGYDLGKLLTGSFGTLAVITQVALRLHPLPQARRWVGLPVSSVEGAQRAVQTLVHSQVMPAGIELDWAPAGGDRSGQGAGEVVAELAGHADGAQACADEAAVLLGDGATVSATPPAWWGHEPDPGPWPDSPTETDAGSAPMNSDADSAPTLCRVTFEIGALAGLLASLETVSPRASCRLRGSAGVGSALLALGGHPSAVVEGVASLRRDAHRYGGAVVVLEAPAEVRGGLDVWGPARGLELMRAVKWQFDPDRRLAPGRFVGGI
jgi:glycolate oxidase FAD binding subunit